MKIPIAVLLTSASLFALDTKHARESLKGLTGFAVEIEDVGSKTKTAGADPDKIKSDVESKLKGAGIKVLSSADALKAPGEPHLAVNLDSITGKDGTVSFEITVSVLQGCSLARDAGVKLPACVTWSRSRVGRANDKPGAFIAQQITTEVDQFLKAYAEVNPAKK